MKTAKLFFSVLLLALAFGIRAEELKCDVCGQDISGRFYTIEDREEGVTKRICANCEQIKERCFICGMPVKDDYKSLPDGRFICARDCKDVIESEAEAKDICKGVKDDLDRVFSRFLTMPGDNVEISIVDKFHLENLFHAPGYETACVSVFGATASNPLQNGKFLHTIDILSHLKKPRLMAVCAHECTHAWVAENVNSLRRRVLDKNTHEAFCELVAYKYMESLHEEGEMENIRRNHYTVGKIQVLLEADARYGFNTIIEWIKNGEDASVEMASLDRIRFVKDGVTRSSPTASASAVLYMPTPAPAAEPAVLMLKGISGSGQHRFALINNATLEPMERERVRVGQTNVIVKCLEIRSNSVVIQVNGKPEKKELFIAVK
jgi:Protein DA1